MKFDELNQLKRFYSKMGISDSEKKKRTNLAYLLYDAIYYTFVLIKTESRIKQEFQNREQTTSVKSTLKDGVNVLRYFDTTENPLIIDDTAKATLENRITDVFNREGLPYEPDYVARLADEVIETTKRHPDDDYYLSQERALLIAQNESNTTYNHVDYITAKKSGKQYKTWITEGDERVRQAHVDVDMRTIPIDEYFLVGNDTMRYPHDYLNGSPDNLINCRCICTYE